MTIRTIRLGERELAYTLARSSRRRTIGLKVGPDGLSVTLPRFAGVSEADRVVREKAGWILDRLEREARRAARPQLQGVDGEEIGWLGGVLTLRVTAHARARTALQQGEGVLDVRVDQALDPELRAATVRRALARWRRAAALELMAPKVTGYADRLGAPRPVVRVREQASRWGSCSADGSIRMNARLIAYDEALIDYVCAHEACHLIEMNHSPRFHALMDQLMPDHKARRARLRASEAPGVEF
ncbi:M48 family metallopeptidase [Alkalicaulis satelles]|uniref:M48 family metallopeptidase n=1 Tax=Alkalicaulis satelles TaxID=2609175 RepID=A0A5M6ZBR1_9PROT|nr:SprT family zinc-dependent metalloprotease [Alkalicaulis satelles]KAA5802186.1 M48 family metallopeptidase [Alkalicaulis satelles]